MKKLFLILFVLVLSMSLVFAQDATTDTNTQATGNTATNNYETADSQDEASEYGDTNANQGMEILDALFPFAPSFDVLRNLNTNNIDRDLNQLGLMINELETDYMFRVQYKVDKLIEEYTNANYIDSNSYAYNNTSFFPLISSSLATDNNIALALQVVQNAYKLYDSIEPFASISGKTNELATYSYDLALYAGLFNMYAGNYRLANNYFLSIKEKDLTEDTNSLLMINNYIAGISHILAQQQSSTIFSKVYYNTMFDALWEVVTLGESDEDQKEAKYNILINTYGPIVYTNTAQFKNIYESYFDKLGIVYADQEQEVLSRPVLDVYKSEETQSENTSGAPADSNSDSTADSTTAGNTTDTTANTTTTTGN